MRFQIKDYIILGLIAVVFFVLFFSRSIPKDYDGYIEEFNNEIQEVKQEVKRIDDNLEKRYERIDTTNYADGLHDITNDLLLRSRK